MNVRAVFNKKCSILAFFLILMLPQEIFAHALLERANPQPDSQLSSSPSDITLTFNERLERELFYIKVLDSKGHPVTENPTEMSRNQKELRLSLPVLEEDFYTVSYSVLSADGHPIRGSYVICVGDPTLTGKADLAGHGDDEHKASTPLWIFAMRIFYFLTLLLTSGWIAWGAFLSFESKDMEHSYHIWTRRFQKVYLAGLLAMITVSLGDLLTNWGLHEITAILFHTSMGLSLTLSLALSVLGFFILRRKKWVDALWVMLLLTAKSFSGHAMAFEPPIRTVLLDLVHLSAASIWTGGLCYLLLFWKSHREAIMRFLPVFSKAALISMIALTITGILSTFIFLPKLSYIGETGWGLWLLTKGAVVGLVILVGAILRHGIKKQSKEKIHIGLKVDIGLMTLIMAIVGIFTYLSPLPPNQPLYWQEMGKSSHNMIAQVTPNVPGVNHFSVNVSLTKPHLQIKHVELFLTYQDDPEIAPIKVPLKAGLPDDQIFTSDGPYLPFAGNWKAEVRVMDSEDNETVYAKDFTIY